MDPSWTDHAFLISWVHYIIVICLPVTVETLSTTTEAVRSVPGESVALDDDPLLKQGFMAAPCPPKDYLHLICDVNIGSETICSHRALIIEQCLYRFHLIYRNSSWNTCLTDANFCRKTIEVLLRENLIKHAALVDTKYYRSTGSHITNKTIAKSISHSLENRTKTNTLPFTATALYPTPVSAFANGVAVTREVTSYFTQTTENQSSTMDGDSFGTTDQPLRTISYIFPIIGLVFILLEVVALCAYSCSRRKTGTPYKEHRQPSAFKDSGDFQEEAIPALTTRPAKSSPMESNLITDEEVCMEDNDIFKSYMNLKFIDESEEPTPARRLLKLKPSVPCV